MTNSRDRRIELDDRDDMPVAHSRPYHTFFEGYEEHKIFDEATGREHIERIYIAPWYKRDISDRYCRAEKLAYILLYLVGTALFGAAGAGMTQLEIRYVCLPSPIALFSLLLLLPAILTHIFSRRKMTVGEYRTGFVRIKRYSLISTVCIALQAVLSAAYALGSGSFMRYGGAVAGFSAAAAVLGGIYAISKRAAYITIPNENDAAGPYIIR